MNCPKCKDITLKKNEFSSPYFCPKCGGLWLESKSLDKLTEVSAHVLETASYPDHDSKTGLCPQGHGILTRARIEDETQPFYLEKCSKCNGIWFDKGEWNRVAEIQFQESLLSIWSISWQRQKRKEKKEAELIEYYKTSLSPELYNDIIKLAERIRKHPEKFKALTLLKEELNKKTH